MAGRFTVLVPGVGVLDKRRSVTTQINFRSDMASWATVKGAANARDEVKASPSARMPAVAEAYARAAVVNVDHAYAELMKMSAEANRVHTTATALRGRYEAAVMWETKARTGTLTLEKNGVVVVITADDAAAEKQAATLALVEGLKDPKIAAHLGFRGTAAELAAFTATLTGAAR